MQSVELPTKSVVWYYVETAIMRDGASSVTEQTTFRANLVRASSPREAEALAIADARHANPDADRVEHFMSRRLTDAKKAKIEAQFEAGTWEGWRF